MQLSAQKVLVTGGAGFIGSSVVRTLRDAGANVTVVDREPFPDDSVPSTVGDLEDPSVRDAAVTPDLDGIVHLAARTSVLASMEDPAGTYQANVAVTHELLELARRRRIERFVMSSTNAVTGDVGGHTIREDMPLRPLTPYGASKAAAEMLLDGYAGSYGMITCAVRLTNVFGPGMGRKDSFVARLMRAALSGEDVQVYGDGSQCRDFVHVDDVGRGFLAAWGSEHTGPLIIGSGGSVTVVELVEAVRRVTGRQVPYTHVPAKRGEMPAVIVAIDRAGELGYHPRVTLEGGLATVWQDFTRPVSAMTASESLAPR